MKDRVRMSLKRVQSGPAVPFATFFVAMLLIMAQVRLREGDDNVFSATLAHFRNIIEFSRGFYHIWSGRILAGSVLAVFLSHRLLFWRIANSLILLLLAVSVYALCMPRRPGILPLKKQAFGAGVCCLILLQPVVVFSSGAAWVTGSTFYVWPVAFGLFSLLSFRHLLLEERDPAWCFFFYIPAGVFGANIEQMAAVLVCLEFCILLFHVIRRRRLAVLPVIQWVSTTAMAAVTLLAPGNMVRKTAETVLWYPSFDMYSRLDKLFLGVSLTLGNLFGSAQALMLVAALLVFALQWNKGRVRLAVSALPVLYLLLRVLPIRTLTERAFAGPFDFQDVVDKVLFDFSRVSPANAYAIKDYLPFFAGCVVCLLMVWLIFDVFASKRVGALAALCMLAALLSSTVIGFSPTLYASGNRVFFVTDALLCVVCAFLLAERLRVRPVHRLFRLGYLALCGGSLVMLIGYLTNETMRGSF